MKVVVLGGTGVLGRLVVERLRAREHEVAAPSRADGVDAETGAGVREAVRGADAVVDCVNIRTASGKRAVAGFTAVARQLSEAVLAEHVPHLVVITIFGVHGEQMQRRNGYYRGKARQEGVLAASGAPVTLVRSPQWFEIAETFLKGRIGPVALVPHMRARPVAAVEAANAIVAAVEAGPGGGERRVSGPEVRDVAEMARAIAARRGDPRFVVAFRIPGVDRLFEQGELLPDADVPASGPRFEEWLATR